MSLLEILQYWETYVFASIGALITWFVKKRYDIYSQLKESEKENDRANFKTEMIEAVNIAIKNSDNKVLDYVIEQDKKLESSLDDIKNQLNITHKGILSIQGRSFKTECKQLLEKDDISFEEMTRCTKNHITYKELGGNEHGDELYKMVQMKFNNQKQNKK